MPECAVLLSPWADLSLSGRSVELKADSDFLLNRSGLNTLGNYYAGQNDLSQSYLSPVFADLSGLPRLYIQVGSNEILLSDALRVSEAAALADVAVKLDVHPGLFHVWPMFAGMLTQADQAIYSISDFVNKNTD